MSVNKTKRKRRGPYKTYLQDGNAEIPRRSVSLYEEQKQEATGPCGSSKTGQDCIRERSSISNEESLHGEHLPATSQVGDAQDVEEERILDADGSDAYSDNNNSEDCVHEDDSSSMEESDESYFATESPGQHLDGDDIHDQPLFVPPARLQVDASIINAHGRTADETIDEELRMFNDQLSDDSLRSDADENEDDTLDQQQDSDHVPFANVVQEDLPGAPPAISHKELRRALQTEQFTSPISTPVSASPAEALLMALSVAIENNSSFKNFVDTVKLLNSLFVSPVLPKSAYLLDQLLHSQRGIERYFYCKECFYSFGNIDHNANPVLVCPECSFSNHLKDLTTATYSVLYPLEPQINALFMNKEISKSLVDPKAAVQMSPENVLRDVYDGKYYKEFVSSLPDPCDEKIISFVFCTDGSPLFKSSSYSIWPFFVAINELPPKIRMRNLLLGALWFGNKKPPMDLFLQPIVNHLRSLSVHGFKVVLDDVEWKMRAFALACCVDSGARGAVQGINTHSGYFSCNWCEIPGEYVDHKVVFPFPQVPPRLRTHSSIVKNATECIGNGNLVYVYGVRNLTPLANLPKFDLANGMVQDFAHNVPFGISRTLLQEWLSNAGKAFYIGAPDNLQELNKRMKLLTPCVEVRRPVRTIEDSSYWNAREYENWTLFYSIPVLMDILPLPFLTHWSYLVQACFLLSRQSITQGDVNNAHNLLLHFATGVEELYGRSYMLYNIHILTHLAQSVARWGPVWAVSTYCFESGIGELKRLLHAQRGVPHQIHRAIKYQQAARILKSTCQSPKSKSFLESIDPKPSKMTNYLPLKDCVAVGSSSKFTRSDEESFLLRQSVHNIDVSYSAVYKKIIKGTCIYTSHDTTAGKRFNNSFAATTSGRIIVIKKIVVDRCSDKVIIFCSDVSSETLLRMPRQGVTVAPHDHCIKLVVSIGIRLELISVHDLKITCVKTEMNDKVYITEIPNVNNVC